MGTVRFVCDLQNFLQKFTSSVYFCCYIVKKLYKPNMRCFLYCLNETGYCRRFVSFAYIICSSFFHIVDCWQLSIVEWFVDWLTFIIDCFEKFINWSNYFADWLNLIAQCFILIFIDQKLWYFVKIQMQKGVLYIY